MQPVRRVNVRGIIFKDGKVFAQTIKKNGVEGNYWCTPGGGIDPAESLENALHREMIEETGVVPKIGRLLLMQQFHDGEKEHLEFFFLIENAEDYETIDLASTSHGGLEIGRCGFIDPSEENLLPKVLQTLDIASYVNEVQPVLVINMLPE